MMEKGIYLFTGINCPKCDVVLEHFKKEDIGSNIEVKDISRDSSNLALAVYLEVGMEVPVLYDNGRVIKEPENILAYVREK